MIEEEIVKSDEHVHVDQSNNVHLTHQTPQSTRIKNRIYPVTEGLQSITSYEKCFKQVLNYIKIHDQQVFLVQRLSNR